MLSPETKRVIQARAGLQVAAEMLLSRVELRSAHLPPVPEDLREYICELALSIYDVRVADAAETAVWMGGYHPEMRL